MNRTYIIAEAGVNHNGSMDNALKLIDVAVAAGADAVKFQAFHAKALNRPEIAQYELTYDNYTELFSACLFNSINPLCTCFDIEWLKRLSPYLANVKIPSSKILDPEYLSYCAGLNTPIFLSTGLSSLKEIKFALDILRKPINNMTLLHCTTAYPCPINYANVSAITNIRETYGYDVGFSDHTNGSLCAVMAVALGAKVIEKHITLDKNMEGPDHKTSADPYMFSQYVKNIRDAEIAYGNGIKKIEECSRQYEKLKDQYNLSK